MNWTLITDDEELKMNPEQVVRNFLEATEGENPGSAATYLADDLVFSGAMLSQPGNVRDVKRIGRALRVAFPNFRWNVQYLRAQDDQVRVKAEWGGTQRGPLNLGAFVGVIGAPAVMPTDREVRVAETFVFTVRGDKISKIRIADVPGGGYISLLRQISSPASKRKDAETL